MRKSLLVIALATTLLPISAVNAAPKVNAKHDLRVVAPPVVKPPRTQPIPVIVVPELKRSLRFDSDPQAANELAGFKDHTYSSTSDLTKKGTTFKAYKNSAKTEDDIKQAIQDGINAGLTEEDAILEITESEPASTTKVAAAAVKRDPSRAGQISAFIAGKYPDSKEAIKTAALAAVAGNSDAVASINSSLPAAVETKQVITQQQMTKDPEETQTVIPGLVAGSFGANPSLSNPTTVASNNGGGGGGTVITCKGKIAASPC